MGDEALRLLQRSPDDEFRFIIQAERVRLRPKPQITKQETIDKFTELKKAPYANFKSKWKFRILSIRTPNGIRYSVNGCQHAHRTKKQAKKCGIRFYYCLEKERITKGLKTKIETVN